MHSARERYDHSRSAGASHDDALDATMDWALRATWNSELGRPGRSDHKTKNRLGLLRTIVGTSTPSARPIRRRRSNSVPASRRSNSRSRSPSTMLRQDGEFFGMCGHMDRIAVLAGNTYILDLKTNQQTLGPSFFKKFTPDNQFSLYAPRRSTGVPPADLRHHRRRGRAGAVTFSRFERQPVPRSEAFLNEWLADTKLGWRDGGVAPGPGIGARNDKACGNYGGCRVRRVLRAAAFGSRRMARRGRSNAACGTRATPGDI